MLGKNLPLSQVFHSDLNNISFFGAPLGDIHIDTLAMSWLCMGGILAAAALITPRMVADGPGGKGQALLEMVYKFIEDLTKGQMGHHYKKFFPLIAAIFIFVLIANFAGVGPWKALEHFSWWPHLPDGEPLDICSPTTDFNVTFGLATISILTYLGSGFWAHGIKYFNHYLIYWKKIPVFINPIEVMDLIIRPATLALRLMMVITADELMRAAALLMVPMLLPTGVMGFELFIGIIQAFVFALLTSIYIGLTIAHH